MFLKINIDLVLSPIDPRSTYCMTACAQNSFQLLLHYCLIIKYFCAILMYCISCEVSQYPFARDTKDIRKRPSFISGIFSRVVRTWWVGEKHLNTFGIQLCSKVFLMSCISGQHKVLLTRYLSLNLVYTHS